MDRLFESASRLIGKHDSNIRCGAMTRQGTPCKAKALKNGRCKNHGGLSTGPRTLEGKERSRQAVVRRWHGEPTRQ